MNGVLWYVLAGTGGGRNRLRVLRVLRDRPRNANQLAKRLDLDYTTVRHHLSVLDLITKAGDGYGVVYQVSSTVRDHWETIEQIEAESADTSVSS